MNDPQDPITSLKELLPDFSHPGRYPEEPANSNPIVMGGTINNFGTSNSSPKTDAELLKEQRTTIQTMSQNAPHTTSSWKSLSQAMGIPLQK